MTWPETRISFWFSRPPICDIWPIHSQRNWISSSICSITMPSRIVKSTLQACALSGLSNFLAQVIRSHRSGVCTLLDIGLRAVHKAYQKFVQAPFILDIHDLLRFVTFSMIMCPFNVLWQSWLESRFPAYTDDLVLPGKEIQSPESDLSDRHGEAMVTMGNSASSKEKPLARRLNIRNTAFKFVLDQSVGAAVNVRILLFTATSLTAANKCNALDYSLHCWYRSPPRSRLGFCALRCANQILADDVCRPEAVACCKHRELHHVEEARATYAIWLCSWAVLGHLLVSDRWREGAMSEHNLFSRVDSAATTRLAGYRFIPMYSCEAASTTNFVLA